MAWLLISFGGACGAVSRYAVYEFLKVFQLNALYSTICVNLLGSFLLGIIYGVLQAKTSSEVYSFAAIGFLGSFTTFSTFALDVNIIGKNSTLMTLGYILATVIGSILLCFAGKALGPAIFSSNHLLK